MEKKTRKRIVIAVIGLLVVAAIVYGFLPQPVPVQTAEVARASLQVIIEEEGETRIEDRFTVTSPSSAYLRRVDLEVGDAVSEGQVVARLEAPRAGILDPRTRAEVAARVEAAQASLQRAEAAAARAAAERDRVRRLHAADSATEQALQQAESEAAQAVAARDAAAAELRAAQATLQEIEQGGEGGPVQQVIRAPTSGRVLEVHQRSAGPISPGQPILDIGNVDQLQISVDVLSQDAVRIEPGTRVRLEQWGNDVSLDARVTRVAPSGFTTVSALGVEERRVPVEATITSPREQWDALGTGYRVLARFVVWEGEDVLQVPTAALFRADGGWAAFVLEEGRAVRRAVEIGRQAGLRAQVVAGLSEGETVIIHPPNDVEDGVRVEERE